jgi:hypothetical protein
MKPSVTQRIGYRLWSTPATPRLFDRALMLLGTFKQIGWLESLRREEPVDAQGAPLPWYTYPAIHWLESVLTGTERIFEYGSGNSTLWFSQRVTSVFSVEHSERWAARMRRRQPPNVTLRHVPVGPDSNSVDGDTDYAHAITTAGGCFDIIVVDGQERNACCAAALPHLRPDGLLILDNSDRTEYEPANRFLMTRHFARIDFIGPAPGLVGWSATSVYSQNMNRWSPVRALPRIRVRDIIDFDRPAEQSGTR